MLPPRLRYASRSSSSPASHTSEKRKSSKLPPHVRRTGADSGALGRVWCVARGDRPSSSQPTRRTDRRLVRSGRSETMMLFLMVWSYPWSRRDPPRSHGSGRKREEESSEGYLVARTDEWSDPT